MEQRLPVAEGQQVLAFLGKLYVNGMLHHRVTNKLKLISMSLTLGSRRAVSLELKLSRTAGLPRTYFLEIFSVYQDGTGMAKAAPDLVTMTTNEIGMITAVDC